ncbi:endonuclease MutS2 [Lentibacillus halophilus]|uniref:Endonuclease MutS2 n=1 Tax=Lentibacillus halophilus TaxID=295065 RepID=A0ABN0Z1T2_9BACI
MNEQILETLEFNKIRDLLKSQAATSRGKERAASLQPSVDIEKVNQLQAETDEARHILRLNMDIPLGGVTDIRASVNRSVIGGTLTAEECLDVSQTLYAVRRLKTFFNQLNISLPILNDLSEQLITIRQLETTINSCIDDNGHIMDSASVKLRGIRSSIRSNESRVRDKLDHYTKSKSKMLSDAIITIRNDRYVLPVKQEYRGSVGGIVHDQSTSGATLFMEPQAVVDLNNQLQESRANEKQEMDRILHELSNDIADHETSLMENVRLLADIDFIAARGKWSRDMHAAMPVMNDDGWINMKQVRHPLIPREDVVPNDVELGREYTSIVITGPNTGGKTVALKTIGLCTLMAQSGLQIPADDGCEMAVFTDVFADIGDEQSIEQNLSTFSSHMNNIVSILGQMGSNALVLFDELGAGTDPQEGAALAMSILDEVIERGARVVATTHYPELKAYGFNRDNAINASVEFDVESFKPTYRLLIGLPGRSNAFDISAKLGLNASIIEEAKNKIGTDSRNVENMIASLEESHHQAEAAYEEAQNVLEESEQLHDELKKAWKQFENQRETLYKKAEEKAEKALTNAREEAETIVNEIRNMKTEAELKDHEWIEAKKMLEEAKPDLSSKSSQTVNKRSEPNRELHPGDDVMLLSANQQGTIIEKVNAKEYYVQVGMMKIKVKRNDLQFIQKQPTVQEKPVTAVKGFGHHVKTELDLRGERYEDAVKKLEKYIDDALLAGYTSVSIIHGKGTGALRKAVNDAAAGHSRIASARPGKAGEGGNGVTVLQLT